MSESLDLLPSEVPPATSPVASRQPSRRSFCPLPHQLLVLVLVVLLLAVWPCPLLAPLIYFTPLPVRSWARDCPRPRLPSSSVLSRCRRFGLHTASDASLFWVAGASIPDSTRIMRLLFLGRLQRVSHDQGPAGEREFGPDRCDTGLRTNWHVDVC